VQARKNAGAGVALENAGKHDGAREVAAGVQRTRKRTETGFLSIQDTTPLKTHIIEGVEF